MQDAEPDTLVLCEDEAIDVALTASVALVLICSWDFGFEAAGSGGAIIGIPS